MNRRIITAAALAACLCFGACTGRHTPGTDATAGWPDDEATVAMLEENAQWLTVQLGSALDYSSAAPALSADPFAAFLQTERFVFSGKDHLSKEEYLYPDLFYETTDTDGFSTYHFPRQQLETVLWEVLGIGIPDGWNTLYAPECDEYLQYFTVEYGPGGAELSELRAECSDDTIAVSYLVQPRIAEDTSIRAGYYQNTYRICTRTDGEPYLRLETIEPIE